MSIALCLTVLLATTGTADAKRHVFEPDIYKVPPPKPMVMVVITRQNLEEDYQVELRESFLPSIVRSVEKGPF